MFRLHSIKQRSEPTAVLVFFFLSSICLLFPGLLLNEPVAPVAAPIPGSSFQREQQKAACRWVFCLCLWYIPSKQLCLLLPRGLNVSLHHIFSLSQLHIPLLFYWCSNPLWPNWHFAHVLRKLNYSTAKVQLCPRSLTQMMKLSYSSFW